MKCSRSISEILWMILGWVLAISGLGFIIAGIVLLVLTHGQALINIVTMINGMTCLTVGSFLIRDYFE